MFNEEKTYELIELFKNNVKPLKASVINKLIKEGADINGIDSECPLFTLLVIIIIMLLNI